MRAVSRLAQPCESRASEEKVNTPDARLIREGGRARGGGGRGQCPMKGVMDRNFLERSTKAMRKHSILGLFPRFLPVFKTTFFSQYSERFASVTPSGT